jgi:hypothetical protein
MEHNRELWTLNDKEKRLLEAAPDMLKALKWAAKNLEEIAIPMAKKYGHVTSLDNALQKTKAAIRKAEGEK